MHTAEPIHSVAACAGCDEDELGSDYPPELQRWGWGPLVVGCVVIATVVLLGGELVVHLLNVGDASARMLYITRGALASGLLAAWAGWYVHQTWRTLEAIQEQLRGKENAFAERARRAENQAGVSALSRILAHEVRNPLNSMALHLTLLDRSATACNSDCSRNVRNITSLLRRENARLDRLVEEYMTYAKGSSMTLELSPVDLLAQIEEVLAIQQSSLDEHDVKTQIAAESDFPPVHANAEKLRQVLHNLVKNALEATPRGASINFELKREGLYAQLRVCDSGPGFKEPGAVFKPFYTTKDTGSGMGLAIVRDVVRAHGGEIAATNSENNGGAVISIRLPLEQQ